jgi:urate oxidase
MLCNKVTCTRMQAASEETAHNQVYKRSSSERSHQSQVENELSEYVEQVPACKALRTNECRSESIKQYLECSNTHTKKVNDEKGTG